MVRVVLVGNGYFGSLYRERIMRNRNYELVGVVDTDYKKLEPLVGMTISDTYEHMLENVDHDAVVICTTPQHHAELSIKAMRNGKHVLCMKPGAMSLSEYDAIRDANKEAKTAWIVDYTLLNSPELSFMESVSPIFGTPESISTSRHVVTGPKPEGVIMDLFPHDVATMLSWFAFESFSVSCSATSTKATATVWDNYRDAQVAFLSASYNANHPDKKTLVRVKPLVEIGNPRFDFLWDQAQQSVELITQGRSVDIRFRHEPDMITETLNKFVFDAKYGLSNVLDSQRVMSVLHAMTHSAEIGDTVTCGDLV